MKALTLTQPWASLVATRHKTIETRSWRTWYVGPLAIHAANYMNKAARDFLCEPHVLRMLAVDLPRGAIVAVGELGGVFHVEHFMDGERWKISEKERALGDYSPGRWAWCIDNVRALHEPIPCRGALGLWNVPPAVVAQIEAAAP